MKKPLTVRILSGTKIFAVPPCFMEHPCAHGTHCVPGRSRGPDVAAYSAGNRLSVRPRRPIRTAAASARSNADSLRGRYYPSSRFIGF